jgi:hypothetical protein
MDMDLRRMAMTIAVKNSLENEAIPLMMHKLLFPRKLLGMIGERGKGVSKDAEGDQTILTQLSLAHNY